MILVDSNCLLRLADTASSQRPVARNALTKLHRNGETLVIVPQNFYEFWATATRSTASNGLGMAPETVNQWLNYLARRYTVLPDLDSMLPTWRQLVLTHGITGFKCHDARLVAAMIAQGIQQILTFNGPDFKKFPNITIIDPTTV